MINSTDPSQIHIAFAGGQCCSTRCRVANSLFCLSFTPGHDMAVSYTTDGTAKSVVSFGTSMTDLVEVAGQKPALSYIEPFFHHQ